MNKQEFAVIAAALRRAYGRTNIMPDDDAVEFWYGMLKDIDYTVCRNAVTQIISQSRFVPTIAEIREKSAETMMRDIPEWDEAWGEVLSAVRRYGYMQEEEALASLDSITAGIVRRMGYQNICTSERIEVERANFREAYKAQVAMEKKQGVLPLSVKNERALLHQKAVAGLVEMLPKVE